MSGAAAQQGGRGDGGCYPCPRCPSELELEQLLDHLDIAHGWSWIR